jgi:hypothetical protein
MFIISRHENHNLDPNPGFIKIQGYMDLDSRHYGCGSRLDLPKNLWSVFGTI